MGSASTMRHQVKHYQIDGTTLQGNDVFAVIEPVYWSANIYDGPQAYEESLRPFSAGQRQIFAINWYRSEVNNGGHDQFYFNSTGIVWKDALAGFRSAGLADLADVLQESVDRMGGQPSLVREERQKYLNDKSPKFDDLDDRFYELEGQAALDEMLLQHIRSRSGEFMFSGDVKVPMN